MQNMTLLFFFLTILKPAFSQNPGDIINKTFLEKLNKDKSYIELKNKIASGFKNSKAGQWGQFVNGVDEKLITQKKIVALTFDACGGKNGNGFDKELIDYLHNEKVPATLFISGKWIDAQFPAFINLIHDPLFEIENHGLNHRPCAINGEGVYGIHGTANVEDAFDEIEANARKINAITGHRPRFYRSATAFIDEACAGIAKELGMKVVSFDVLSGDAVPFTPESVIVENVLKNIRPGSIVIMHLNHPEWYTYEAILKIIPKLRQQGYNFVRLDECELTTIKDTKKR
jgi:peptidoglycan/xylan/chitin deacetylase (PgdA/CDA1 family)